MMPSPTVRVLLATFRESLHAGDISVEGGSYCSTKNTRDDHDRFNVRLKSDGGPVKMSDCWEEVARSIRASPKVLKNIISEYNLFCHQR